MEGERWSLTSTAPGKDSICLAYTEEELLADMTPEVAHADELAKLMDFRVWRLEGFCAPHTCSQGYGMAGFRFPQKERDCKIPTRAGIE